MRRLLPLLAVLATAIAIVPVVDRGSNPLSNQPWPDSYEYANAAWELAHGHGYVTYVNERRVVSGPRRLAHPYRRDAVSPRYPFGMSAILAPFTLVFPRPQGADIGARAIVVAYLVAVIAAAWLLAGPLAGVIAAALMFVSPFTHATSVVILSDPLAALLTVLVLIGLIRNTKRWLIGAGIAAGLLVDVRLVGGVALPAILIAIPGRRRWLPIAAAAPLVALLGYYQWRAFGSPFTSGYSYWEPRLDQFDPKYIVRAPLEYEGGALIPVRHASGLVGRLCGCDPMRGLSNVAFYPSVLAGMVWIYFPPFMGLLGLATAIHARATPAARFTLAMIAMNLVVLLVYFYQAARLIAPAASLLLVYTPAGCVTVGQMLLGRVNGRLRVAAD